jgi:hypothetical protein
MKRQPVQLVKIEKDRIAFFSGKDLVLAVNGELDKNQLEHYRINHQALKEDAGALPQKTKVVEINEDVLEELVENTIFLNEHVLKGLTREQWFDKTAPDVLA